MVDSADIRNIVLAGHSSCGKTTLIESLLFVSDSISRQGKIEEGHTVSDYNPNEIKRKFSINTSIAPLNRKGKKINILDTPGFTDFYGEVESAMSVAETAVIIVDSLSGIQVQTNRANSTAQEKKLARLFFINRLDKEHAKFSQILTDIQDMNPNTTVAAFLPIGLESSFKGIVDLISLKAFEYSEKEAKEIPIPEDLKAEVDEKREKIVEAAAENDDALLEKYLDSGDLSTDEIFKGLRAGLKTGSLSLVFCGSALTNVGIATFLDNIAELTPSPLQRAPIESKDSDDKEVKVEVLKDAPFTALVFKIVADPYVGKLSYFKVFSGSLKKDQSVINISTTGKQNKQKIAHLFEIKGKKQTEVNEIVTGAIGAAPKLNDVNSGDTIAADSGAAPINILKLPESVLSFAIAPKSKGDDEKLSTALHKIAIEDPTLKYRRDPQTKQTVISGMGDMHLEIVIDMLKQRFDVEAELSSPKIPYRETIKGSSKSQGKYKKQTGGRGQYGDVWLRLESLERGKEFEFLNEIKGGSVPSGYIPAVEKGVHEVMDKGVIAGYPVVDVRVALYDGSFHPVDSSEMAFKIAASMAFKKAFEEASPSLLEPIMNVEVHVPEKYMGDVIGDLSSKRGRVSGTDSAGKYQTVKAQAPLAEVSKYAIELRSITHGEGDFSMAFSHYEEVPPDISQRITMTAKEQKEEVT